MRKFLFVLIAATILFALGASEWLSRAGYGAQSSAQANVPPPASARQLSNEEAVPSQGEQFAGKGETGIAEDEVFSVQDTTGVSSTNSKALLGEEVPSDPAIDNFGSLYTQFANQYIKPGWLHFVYQEEHPEAQSSAEYNGITIPATFVLDTWYQLDSSLSVVEGVTIMRDEAGQIVQVTVYRDRVWHNLTMQEDFSVEQSPSVRLDGRFLAQLEDSFTNGGKISQTSVASNGQELTLFQYEETFDPPIVLNDLAIPVKKGQRYAYFDPISGHLAMLETVFTTLNGKEIMTLRTSLQLIENINPPNEILAYLEEIK